MKHWLIFYHEGTMQHYVWDGNIPIPLGGEHLRWDPSGAATYTATEDDVLQSLIGTKKKQFTIKGRGRFIIVSKGTFKTEP